MTYANFKGNVKKVNIKPKGVQEIVLEISGDELDGQLEAVAGMVDLKVNIELDAERIMYKRKVNATTNLPDTQYHVSEKGVVEVKLPEQLELEGLPEEKKKIIEEDNFINRSVVDEFVLSDISPEYEGYHKDLIDILKRRINGESYITLAKVFEMKKSDLVEQIKLYRMQVAPLAEAWHKWKTEKEENH